ncbi:hypothetical protein R3P38DRAFT_2761725 [Favolaschia claudopus]|uniref:Uncharacterized protein n=1 Tax=Favolaschia claudopus TaxID=2862362 RepID=A0AAW0DSF1_9AGAR
MNRGFGSHSHEKSTHPLLSSSATDCQQNGLTQGRTTGGLRSPVPTTRVAGDFLRNKPARSHARISVSNAILCAPIRPKLGVFTNSIDCLRGNASFSESHPKFCRLRLAALDFLALHHSGGLESVLVYPASPLQIPRFFKSRFSASSIDTLNSIAAHCTGLGMAVWIRAEQRDTRAPDRVVEDLILRKRISVDLRCTHFKFKPYAHVLQRGFGRRQAIPALQLASPRQHHHPARGLSLRARREAARVALTIQKFFPRAALRGAADSNQRVAERHELFGSSTTRHAAALYRVDCIEIDPASGTLRQKPLSRLQPTTFPVTSRALWLVEDAPRSGAYSFHYIEILPASGTFRFSSAEQRSSQVEFPTFSGIRIFAVRRAQLAQGLTNAPRKRGCSTVNKFQDQTQNFEFSASAEPRLCAVRLSNSIFRAPLNLDFNINGVQASVKLAQIGWIPKLRLHRKLKTSTLTQNSRVGWIFAFQTVHDSTYTPARTPGKTASCKSKNPIFLPGTIRNKTETYLTEEVSTSAGDTKEGQKPSEE